MKANPDKFQAIVIGKLEAQSALSWACVAHLSFCSEET